jgi:L-amino acid N-acyltransferase YncA
MGAPERMEHVLRRVRSDGVGATARHSLKLARSRVYLVEEHVWYELDVDGERPRRELPDEVRLFKAGEDQLAGAVEMGQHIDEIRRRRAAGNDLWLAEDDGGPLFRCWIYRSRAPVLAAPGGWLEIPADTVVLEDSATTPRARGRGIAPGAWTAIADSLRAEGLAHMITKVGVHNEASRKAVVKSGFREIGVMRLVKRGPHRRTTVSGAAPGLGSELAARLSE